MSGTVENSLKVRKIHEAYVGILLVFAIIFLATRLYADNQKVTDYLTFGLTITSFFLSLVAIFMTIVANSDLSRNFARLRDAGSDTQAAAAAIQSSASKLSWEIGSLQAVVNKIDHVTTSTYTRLDDISRLQTNKSESATEEGPAINKSYDWGYWLDTTSYVGALFLYCAKRLSDTGIPLRRRKLAQIIETDPEYLYGYAMACDGAAIFDMRSRRTGMLIADFETPELAQIQEAIEDRIRSQEDEEIRNAWRATLSAVEDYVSSLLGQKREISGEVAAGEPDKMVGDEGERVSLKE